MKTVRSSEKGIDYLSGLLRTKSTVVSRVVFWKIPHKSGKEDIGLKIGRYAKNSFSSETLECTKPKSELTLDNEEFKNLILFLSENYEPFKEGIKKYIPIEGAFDKGNIEDLRAIFNNPEKEKLLNFINNNNILPDDLLLNLEIHTRNRAISEFESMLSQDLVEQEWQNWFTNNSWVLGSEFVKILDEREIDTSNITDYLMQAYDGFLDIIEIKRPGGSMNFWATAKDHDNYVPSSDLVKSITQATRYIHEVEREANSIKFLEKVNNTKTIKPRCILIFGRSNNWDDEQREAYRILNSSYHNLTIMTYDHVLDRAKRILGIKSEENKEEENYSEVITVDDIPF